MDKKECLEKCAKMWFWMMLHPKQEKQNYFPIPNVDGDVYNSCYCCEHVSPKGALPLICSQCLLLDLWVGKMKYVGDDCRPVICVISLSPHKGYKARFCLYPRPE